MQQTARPPNEQILEILAAVQRNFLKAVIEPGQIGLNRDLSIVALAMGVQVADTSATRAKPALFRRRRAMHDR